MRLIPFNIVGTITHALIVVVLLVVKPENGAAPIANMLLEKSLSTYTIIIHILAGNLVGRF